MIVALYLYYSRKFSSLLGSGHENFNHGLLPSHYLSSQLTRMLRAYVNDYLTEEIRAEGLVRNLPAFARFMELLGFTNNQMLNYANIARDCAIDVNSDVKSGK